MTAQYLVYVFLAVSALPLVVAFFFAPQVTGSAGVQRFAAAINAGARALLKRRYTALALLGMLLPTIAHAQPEHAAGEANLILPDLLTVQSLRPGRTRPVDDRFAVLRRRPVVRPHDLLCN